MTHIEQALVDARDKGGWKGEDYCIIEDHYFINERMWIDPAFWSALGGARGWKEGKKNYGHPDNCQCGWTKCEMMQVTTTKAEWLIHWHAFIDHLAEGKDANSFFETL